MPTRFASRSTAFAPRAWRRPGAAGCRSRLAVRRGDHGVGAAVELGVAPPEVIEGVEVECLEIGEGRVGAFLLAGVDEGGAQVGRGQNVHERTADLRMRAPERPSVSSG